MARERRLDHAHCKCGARAFAEPHSKIEQRLLAEPRENFRMRAFGRDMAGEAVGDRVLAQCMHCLLYTSDAADE